jgi:hypothetical protein
MKIFEKFASRHITKRLLYRALCAVLEKYHSILDPCGFKHLNNDRCWHGIPCCHSGCTCEYLSETGCTVHSLGCLFWLCHDSLDYLNQIASNPLDAHYLQAKSYLKLRPYLVKIAEYYIPLQQRASEDNTFRCLYEDPQLKYIPKWFDNWAGIPWDDPNLSYLKIKET